MARRRKGLSSGLKLILTILTVGALGGAGYWAVQNQDAWMPEGRSGSSGSSYTPSASTPDADYDLIRVAVVTWGGYAGGQYFNRGFNPSEESRFLQEYGLPVEFVVMDDYLASREAWKADEVQLLWATADSFPTEAASMSAFEPTIVFQADWSRGGDVIVAQRGINAMSDLRGKRIAVAFGTPSHTFLLRSLEAAGMTVRDIKVIEVPSAIDAAATFKANQVEAAVVWSPDDEDCVKAVRGAKRLASTKEATHIIADVFYAKKSYVETHEEALTALIEGWMRGAAEVNSSQSARREAIRILSEGLDVPEDFAEIAINNARLTTYGDNRQFFNLDGSANGVTGERLYMETGALYQSNTNLVSGRLPAWRQVTDTGALRNVRLSGPEHEAEGRREYTAATSADVTAPAIASKSLRVNFSTGSSTLDQNARTIIEMGFVPTLNAFQGVRVRVAGNTDKTGSRETNQRISRARAQAVADFLSQEYGFDPNRFVVVGNGPDNPVCEQDTSDCYAQNRRTDFELLQ